MGVGAGPRRALSRSVSSMSWALVTEGHKWSALVGNPVVVVDVIIHKNLRGDSLFNEGSEILSSLL